MVGVIIVVLVVALGITLNIITYKKAKALGIIHYKLIDSTLVLIVYIVMLAGLMVFTFNNAGDAAEYSALLDDAQERGSVAFVEYEGWADSGRVRDERLFINERVEHYTAKANESHTMALIGGAFVGVFLMVLSIQGNYITKKGILSVGSFRPIECFAEERYGRILVYSAERPRRCYMRVGATEKNLEKFEGLIRPAVTNNSGLTGGRAHKEKKHDTDD